MTFPVDRTYTRWIPKPIIFSKIVIFFGIELVTIFVFLLGFSEHWNSIGDLKTSNTLFVAALVFFLVNLIIFLPYYLYCSIIVLKMMRKREFEVSEPVRLALFKVDFFNFFFFFSFFIFSFFYQQTLTINHCEGKAKFLGNVNHRNFALDPIPFYVY